MENDVLIKKEIEQLNRLYTDAQKMQARNPVPYTLFVRFKRSGNRTAVRFYLKNSGFGMPGKEWYVHKDEVFQNQKLIISYCAQEVILLAARMLKQNTGDVRTEFQKLYEKFYNVFGNLTPKCYIPNKIMARLWLESQPTPNYRTDELLFQTMRGEKVRSKFEKMVADTLYLEGLFYQYERQLSLSGNTILPDFTIIDPNTGEFVYLEACGKLDDCEYLMRNLNKLKLYESNGCFPGDKLLMVFDHPGVPFDTELFRLQLAARFRPKGPI